MHHHKLEPGTEYLVVDPLDEGELASFMTRLSQARDYVSELRWAGDKEAPAEHAQYPELLPTYEVEMRSRHAGAMSWDVEFKLWTDKSTSKQYVRLLIASQGGRMRNLELIEPVRADRSNAPCRKDFKDENLVPLVTAFIDRWRTLALRQVWRTDPAYQATSAFIWDTVDALFTSYGEDEIYHRMVARLALQSTPFGPTVLIPAEFQDDMYNVRQFLTAEGSAAFRRALPVFSRVDFRFTSDENLATYELKPEKIFEPHIRAASRGRLNVIETMQRLTPFGDVEGRILVDGVHVPD